MDIGKIKREPRVSARRRLLPGKASKYISQSAVNPGDLFVLTLRVSNRQQQQKGNLDDQEQELRRRVEKNGAKVIDVVSYVGPGNDPIWIGRAAALAEKCGAKILAESTDRLIRHPGYNSVSWPDARARESDLQDLKFFAGDCELMTVVHPDASLSKVKSHATKRGQREKGKNGGRPKKKNPGYKKQRRIEMMPKALNLHEQGQSLRSIARQLGIPLSNVRRWITSNN